MGSEVEIRSSDGSKVLCFTVLEKYGADDCLFAATVAGDNSSGSVRAGTYPNGPPSRLFDEIDRSWRAPDSPHSWHSTGHELTLTASYVSRGAIELRVEMCEPMSDTRLSLRLDIEGGAIRWMAEKLRATFGT